MVREHATRRRVSLARVTVIGTGYLGLTHAVCLADLGHQVLAIDVDATKIAMAARGEAPFFEPGLEPLLREGFAVQDSLAPDRIVLGVTADGTAGSTCGRAEARLREIYRGPLEAGSPLLVMDLETAELV